MSVKTIFAIIATAVISGPLFASAPHFECTVRVEGKTLAKLDLSYENVIQEIAIPEKNIAVRVALYIGLVQVFVDNLLTKENLFSAYARESDRQLDVQVRGAKLGVACASRN